MTILVTGGTVFASRFCAEYFVKKGHEVYVLNRNTRPQSDGVHLIECNRFVLGDRLKSIYFDLVLDVASYNEHDVSTLVEALGDYGKYIFISSSAVYPETNEQPFKEIQTCGANSIWGDYGMNKLLAEQYLLDNVKHLNILRPPYLYGPMNNLYREAFVFECAERGIPFCVPNDGDMPLQFFHIEDMCRFIEILAENDVPQKIFNVGNSNTVTISEWVTMCYEVLGKVPVLKHISGHDQAAYFSFRDYAYVLDVTEQNKLLPDTKSLTEGLRESYEWYRNNRGLVRTKDFFAYISKNFQGE